jgi:hypothetical protein
MNVRCAYGAGYLICMEGKTAAEASAVFRAVETPPFIPFRDASQVPARQQACLGSSCSPNNPFPSDRASAPLQ